MQGLYFQPVELAEFNNFALRQATSSEIGRIGTIYDNTADVDPTHIIRNLGLYGCGKLCAVAVCVIVPNKSDGHNSCRLDTVIVDNDLRKLGLATFTITTLFMDLISDPALDISRLFSYAVHPGTVAALKKLKFSDPPPKGAPLVAVEVDEAEDSKVFLACQSLFGELNSQLGDTCAKCKTTDDPGRRWCEALPQNHNE